MEVWEEGCEDVDVARRPGQDAGTREKQQHVTQSRGCNTGTKGNDARSCKLLLANAADSDNGRPTTLRRRVSRTLRQTPLVVHVIPPAEATRPFAYYVAPFSIPVRDIIGSLGGSARPTASTS